MRTKQLTTCHAERSLRARLILPYKTFFFLKELDLVGMICGNNHLLITYW